ncbi:MAG: hypothetical protein ACPLKP_01755 [Microgenomates group bacterium]
MKKSLIALIPLALILIAVLGYKFLNKKNISSSKQFPSPSFQSSESISPTESTSAKEKASSKINLVCRYRPNEKIEVISYLKEGKIFSEIKGENQGFDKFLFFNDTGKIYYWNSSTKQGFTLTATTAQPNTQFEFKNTDEYLGQMEKYRPDCREESLNDELFNIPSDVNFQDMEKLQEMMRQNQ